jgi:hypothetical protein
MPPPFHSFACKLGLFSYTGDLLKLAVIEGNSIYATKLGSRSERREEFM